MTPTRVDAERRVHGYTRLERGLAGLVVVLVLVAVAWSWLSQSGQRDIRKLNRQNQCIALLIADYAIATADAFASPPAPNPDRTDAVTAIRDAGEALKRLRRLGPEHVCRDLD